MSAKIAGVSTETLPALRLIGKWYTDPQNFVAYWHEWFDKGWFEEIKELGVAPENRDAYLGATPPGAPCYWIGLLFPPGTPVPDGYDCVEIPASRYAVFKFEGKKEWELFGEEGCELCAEETRKRGLSFSGDGWGIERSYRYGQKGIVLFEELSGGFLNAQNLEEDV